jgi:enoyl-CoA hydratase/carnithine racemase
MADEKLRREDVNGIHHVIMSDGPNALNPDLMEAVSGVLAELREDASPPVLLRSAHQVLFSPGWDLKRLAGADRAEVALSLERFNQLIFDLFSYPGPTGAAIEGHAVAGGCLLALCCDLRIMAVGRPRIGLSELNLGVPVPSSSLIMLGRRLAPNVVEELVVGGDGCDAERARELGVVHRIAEPSQVIAKTERELARLASKPARAFSATKGFLLGDSWQRMSGMDPAADEAFLDCWFSPETKARIDATVQRLGT